MPCRRIAGSFAAASLAFGLAGASPSVAGSDASLETLLRESIDAPRTVSYVGQFDTVRFSSNRASATIVKIEHLAPDATRRWYLAPESIYGDYVVTRGLTNYEFDTKRKNVTISHDPTIDNAISPTGEFDRVMRNYRVVADGEGIVADRPTISIVLVNRYTGERAGRIWLDRESHLALKKEEYHANGSVAAQSRFEEIGFTAAIPPDVFDSEIPTGYTKQAGVDLATPSSDVARALREAGFKPIEPKVLPQGFAVTSAAVTTVDGVRTLQLVYSDGLRSISLFENARGAAADFGTLRPKTTRFDNHDAEYVEDGPTTLLTWNEEGLHFALVGDLLLPELVSIAISVVP